MRLLLLGGTTEASELARALAGDGRYDVTLSLAGRTARPLPQPVPVRRGGFGGAAGLADWMRAEGVAALIDATHPFAAQMTRNAAEAAAVTGVPLLRIDRPQWRPKQGDRWTEVPDMEAAVEALGRARTRVLLTVGQTELAPFARAPWHAYVVRSVDPPPAELLPDGALVIAARGPFRVEDEMRLLRERGIEAIVTKNSGGEATRAKLRAARALGVPVVMVARPPTPAGLETVADAGAAARWLHARHRALLGA